jgi:two-component system, NarL family, nitrate/nitrite response regulator NarL
MFRLGLVLALRSLGFANVDEAVDGLHAVDLCRGRSYDAVLLDLKMPRMNGIEAARAIASRDPSVEAPSIIVMTTYGEPAVIKAAMEAGAAAFLGKETEPEELARCIDDLLAGRRRVVPHHGVPELSSRESDVLRLLLAGTSTKEMASLLGISADTVKDHLGRIYAKLGVFERVSAVNEARRLGLVLLDELEGA